MNRPDADGRIQLATIAPMLPLPVATALLRGIAQAAELAGCRDVSIGDGAGMRIVGVPPKPGERPEMHFIEIAASRWHRDMVVWSCQCGETDDNSHADPGRALQLALRHVPAGEPWVAEPHRDLVGEKRAR